ncbi:unnamed protein product [Rhizophagus irregularis]|uniref:Uncharacterized protein n=1 Tax=Rhizophagus irregularis TaxID=588596 RepID=A0A2N1MHJ2_9GLOM|nr:hypothetical protein RhiirC2_856465 [Rhizophagus irregularis]CAB4378633.1 unnamed protein product [Rhizophagus irregularis]CAB5369964.1 unnamed protein product [Rhizophagus irregularis]
MTSNKTIVFVEIVGDSTPTMKKLNLENNLSNIRKELKKNINDMNILLFAIKVGQIFAKTEPDDENDTILNDIIFENSGSKFLYLMKNSNPSWKYLNEKCKLDFGRITSFDGIKEASSKAFKLKDCEFKPIDSKGYKKGRLEFKSEEDWMKKTNLFFGIDINVQNFIGLGLSIGKSKDENFKDEVNSTYVYTEIGKASLKFNKENLELTSDFSNDVKNAIKCKDHNKFSEIINKYGQFVPTEVILGGRVYFKGVKSLSENSTNKTKESSVNMNFGPSIAKIGGNSNDSERKSDFYSFDHMKILGGRPPVDENFDEKIWNKSLEDYRTWDCIELKNPINIFKLLPDDIYKEAFKSIGKRILRTIVKDYEYRLDNPERYQIIELTDEESKIILNKDADCDIFATVVDDDENSKKVFFNCQILKNQNAKPSIIIHVIQKEPQKRICKLKIGIMIIGYDVDFNFINSNVSVELLVNNNYNFNDGLMANNLFLGIPVLEYFNHLNDSITIGHNFRKLNNELIIEPFSYCSKKHCYHFSNLPQFSFYTIVIKNYSNIYESRILEYPKKDEIKFSDKCPKYISMYFSEADSYLPVFMNQKSEKVYLKHFCNKCEKCKQEPEYNIKLKTYSIL